LNYNRTIIGGRLGRDPELRFLPTSNTAVCSIAVAVSEKWKDKSGEQQERTTWLDCEAFGRTAEVINQYFRKGSNILIDGKLRQDNWTDKDGNKRSKIKLVIDSFEFVDSKGGDTGNAPPAKSEPKREQAAYEPDDDPESIPF